MAEDTAQGMQELGTSETEFGVYMFIVQQALAKLCTVTLVKVISCTNNGALAPVGYVDVQPMVNQMTGTDEPVEHGIIYNVPYFRLQGGVNAIIIDPAPGDIGVCAFASRDISSVKASKKLANPGSKRTFDFADGLYFGGMLNGQPTQYIRYSATGIDMVSPTKITLTAPEVDINASTKVVVTTPEADINASSAFAVTSPAATMSGTLAVTGTVTGAGKSLSTHTHTSTTPGTPTSAPN